MTFSSIKRFMTRRQHIQRQFIETLLCGLVGGVFFTLFHLPLSWMLGPLTAILIWKLKTNRKLFWPVSFKNGGQMLLGYSMGLSFTLESAGQIVNHLPTMAIMTVLMVVFGLAVAYFISRVTGINIPSAVMGTTPGGLSQMAVLSEEIKGADPTIVTFMQTIRMLTVIFTVPALSIHAFSRDAATSNLSNDIGTQMEYGSFFQILIIIAIVLTVTLLSVAIKFPTPWIIGPLLTSAILTVSGVEIPQLPTVLILIAQLCLGVYLGLGIKINMLTNWRKLLPYSFVSGIMIVGFAFGLSYCLHTLYHIDMTTAFLCIAPGGLPEMGVTAHTVHADVSMVAAYQLFRVFFILFIVPIFLRKIFGKQKVDERSIKSV
ncbi:AbrB family transcriptional regulator [Metabacillus sediminilitoris]|uniref:AbrB family transcriptional regulator n=1 Tax=Metabacillus sediminilitoris TaxID=2567941 RepID=A0A4S4BYB0_9BACI|nr:AbrB family transcriptional regulator [Metabacillus sediminilitoris]QGQ44615.1 AbrB family transcriptional regulator [Metabacillus sediminilitoris]THF80242.1 AbrB family transcriptional regulator [Metabacillus sediminilitoris]